VAKVWQKGGQTVTKYPPTPPHTFHSFSISRLSRYNIPTRFFHLHLGGHLKTWYFYAIMTVVTWGLWGVFSKLASNYTKPRQALLFQTVGVLAFAVIVLFLEKFKIEWNAAGFTWAALGGFFAFVGFLTFFAALEKGSASTVVTLSALYPVVTILISITLLHEKLTTKQGAGIVLALIASALLAS
jgi:transporter family protein